MIVRILRRLLAAIAITVFIASGIALFVFCALFLIWVQEYYGWWWFGGAAAAVFVAILFVALTIDEWETRRLP